MSKVAAWADVASRVVDRWEAAWLLIESAPRRHGEETREALVAIVAGGLFPAAVAGLDGPDDLPFCAGARRPRGLGSGRDEGRRAKGEGRDGALVGGATGNPNVEKGRTMADERRGGFTFRVSLTATATLYASEARQARDRLVVALDGAVAKVTTGECAGLELVDMRTSTDVTLTLVDGVNPVADLAQALERWRADPRRGFAPAPSERTSARPWPPSAPPRRDEPDPKGA